MNCATVPAALVLLWYLRLSPPLAAGMAVALLVALAAVTVLGKLPVPLWVLDGLYRRIGLRARRS